MFKVGDLVRFKGCVINASCLKCNTCLGPEARTNNGIITAKVIKSDRGQSMVDSKTGTVWISDHMAWKYENKFEKHKARLCTE